LGSNLVRLILMLRDEDDVMPPAGKSALTAEETMSIIQWIQLGCSRRISITVPFVSRA